MPPLLPALPVVAASSPALAWTPMGITAAAVITGLLWGELVRDLPRWPAMLAIGFVPLGALLALLVLPKMTDSHPRWALGCGLALTLATGLQAYAWAFFWHALGA